MGVARTVSVVEIRGVVEDLAQSPFQFDRARSGDVDIRGDFPGPGAGVTPASAGDLIGAMRAASGTRCSKW